MNRASGNGAFFASARCTQFSGARPKRFFGACGLNTVTSCSGLFNEVAARHGRAHVAPAPMNPSLFNFFNSLVLKSRQARFARAAMNWGPRDRWMSLTQNRIEFLGPACRRPSRPPRHTERGPATGLWVAGPHPRSATLMALGSSNPSVTAAGITRRS